MVDDTGSADLINFPVYMDLTLDSNVYDDAGSGADYGSDIRFALDPWGYNKLDHDTLYYSNFSNKWQGYVNIPVLDYNTDTKLYVFYGCSTSYCVDQENAEGVWDRSDANETALYYGFEETSSPTLDGSRNNNNGTWGSAVSTEWASPYSKTGGYYAKFDNGTNEYIDLGSGSSLNDADGNYTIEFWYNPTSADMDTVVQFDSGKTYPFEIAIDRDGTGGNYFEVWMAGDNATNAGRHWWFTGEMAASTWYRIAVVVSGGALQSIWKNDTKYTDLGTYTYTSAPSAGNPTIGKPISGTTYFSGLLDDFVFSNTIRSDQWLKTRYNNISNASYVTRDATATALAIADATNGSYGVLNHERLLPIANDCDSDVCDTAMYWNTVQQTYKICDYWAYTILDDYDGNLALQAEGCNQITGTTDETGNQCTDKVMQGTKTWTYHTDNIYYATWSANYDRIVDVREDSTTWLTLNASDCDDTPTLNANEWCYNKTQGRVYVNKGGAPTGSWTFSHCATLVDYQANFSNVIIGQSVRNDTDDTSVQIIGRVNNTTLIVNGKVGNGKSYIIGNNYSCVSDSSDSTYIFDQNTDGEAEKIDMFRFTKPMLFVSGTPRRIRFYARMKKDAGLTTGNYKFWFKPLEKNSTGNGMINIKSGTVTDSWTWYQETFDASTDDPDVTWRYYSQDYWDDFTFGVGLDAAAGTGKIYCSEIVIELEYGEQLISPKTYIKGTTSGADTTYGYQLVDSSASFESTIEARGLSMTYPRLVYNLTDGTWARVVQVLSGTKLGLSHDIFTSGEEYLIMPIHHSTLKNGLDSVNNIEVVTTLLAQDGSYSEREAARAFSHSINDAFYIQGANKPTTTKADTGAVFNVSLAETTPFIDVTGAGDDSFHLLDVSFVFDSAATTPYGLLDWNATTTGTISDVAGCTFTKTTPSSSYINFGNYGIINIDSASGFYVVNNVGHRVSPLVKFIRDTQAVVINNTLHAGYAGGFHGNSKVGIVASNISTSGQGLANSEFYQMTKAVGLNNFSSGTGCEDTDFYDGTDAITLTADANVTVNLSKSTGVENYQAVSDGDNNTWVGTTSASYVSDRYTLNMGDNTMFSLAAMIGATPTISSVDVVIIYGTTATTGLGYKVTLYDGASSSYVEDTTMVTTGAHTTDTISSFAAPDGSWTFDDIAGLELKLELKTGGNAMYIYSATVVVNYSLLAPTGNKTSATVNNGTTPPYIYYENTTTGDLRLDDAYASQTPVDAAYDLPSYMYDYWDDYFFWNKNDYLDKRRLTDLWDIGAHELMKNRTFYVKTNGNDNADGLSDANAWASIQKVNAAMGTVISDGDTIRFACGDVWDGTKSYNPSLALNISNVTVNGYQKSGGSACSSTNMPTFNGEYLFTPSTSNCEWIQSAGGGTRTTEWYLAKKNTTPKVACDDSGYNYGAISYAASIYGEPVDKECGTGCNTACSGAGSSNEDDYPGDHCTGDFDDTFYLPYGTDTTLHYTEDYYPIEDAVTFYTIGNLYEDEHILGNNDSLGFNTVYLGSDTDPDTKFAHLSMPASYSDQAINIVGSKNVTIDGIKIIGYRSYGILTNTAINPTIRNCDISRIGMDGLNLLGVLGTRGQGITNATVDGGKYSLCGRFGVFVSTGSNGTVKNITGNANRMDGLFIGTQAAPFLLVEKNNFYHNALEYWLNPVWSYTNYGGVYNTSKSIYERKYIYRYNRSHSVPMPPAKEADSTAMGTARADNVLWHHNVAFKSAGPAWVNGRMTQTGEKPHRNSFLFHNTAYDCAIKSEASANVAERFSYAPSGGKMYSQNNIVYFSSSTPKAYLSEHYFNTAQAAYGYNYFYNANDATQSTDWWKFGMVTYTLAEVQSTFNIEANSVYADPKIAAAELGKYYLMASSPCRDTSNVAPMNFIRDISALGSATLYDIENNPVPSPEAGDPTKPDLGAFEYQGGGIVPQIMNYFRRRISRLDTGNAYAIEETSK
jgi:hypothetical protein